MAICSLTNNLAKHLRSLQTKKARNTTGLFLVEGLKPVVELLQSSWHIQTLCATPEFLAAHQGLINQKQAASQEQTKAANNQPIQLIEASPKQLASLGSLTSNNAAVAVVKQTSAANFFTKSFIQATAKQKEQQKNWLLAVDGVNDPGNLGSLLRIADWFGIEEILCSPTSVEVYNPKVIAASKGSFLRVKVSYLPLTQVLPELAAAAISPLPLVGAVLNGTPLPQLAAKLKQEASGVLVLGSEAHGLSPEVAELLTHQLTIPRLGKAESLNLGVAAGIICAGLLLD